MGPLITSGASGLREDLENNFRAVLRANLGKLDLAGDTLARVLALRAGLRGGAGHLRADHRRPRLRLPRLARDGRELPRFGVRVVRRLRRNRQFENTEILFVSDNGAAGSAYVAEPD